MKEGSLVKFFIFFLSFTIAAGVVHQDDLLEEDGRRGVQDAVHRPQQGAPGLVVEHDDHAGGRQGGASLERLLYTSAATTRRGERGVEEHKDVTVLYSSWETQPPRYSMCRLPPPGGVSVSLVTTHVWQAAFETSPQPERDFN